VQALNQCGRGLEANGGSIARLDADDVLDQARIRTGLADFGSDDFLEGLAVLTHALEAEAELTVIGRIIARDEIVNALECRLWVQEAFRCDPEITREQIRAPILIGGPARSGTTILHELLAQDPANRAPLGWEVRHPWPRGKGDAARRTRADHELKVWYRVTPEMQAMHPWGALLPQECTFIMNHSFRFGYFAAAYHIPSYARWLAHADPTPAYEYHRRFLQVLQRNNPGKRWVLKCPGYITRAKHLLSVYPDAKFVHTHRDPLRAIASMASFIGTLQWMRSDRLPDVRAYSRGMSQEIDSRFEQVQQLHRAGVFHRANYSDVLYHEFIRVPIDCVARVYEQFGLALSDEAAERMGAWMAVQSQAKRGAASHRYRFADTGLDPVQERRRHRAYEEHYGIVPEI